MKESALSKLFPELRMALCFPMIPGEAREVDMNQSIYVLATASRSRAGA